MKPEFMYYANYEKAPDSVINEAIELINAEASKIRYDNKAQWLEFKSNDLQFLKTLKAKLQSNRRRMYGSMHGGLEIRILPDSDTHHDGAVVGDELAWQFWYRKPD